MYVYLLVESGRQSVKIGKSNNPVRRSNELAQRFDLDYSRQVFMGSERDAYALERTLHFFSGTTTWTGINATVIASGSPPSATRM